MNSTSSNSPTPPSPAGLPTMLDPEFDAYAEDYDAALQRGLKGFSGHQSFP